MALSTPRCRGTGGVGGWLWKEGGPGGRHGAEGERPASRNVYTVKLKSGLKWSDGEPLTAQDFEYGIKRECSPEVAGPYQYVLGETILNIVGCDDYFNSGEKTPEEQAALRDEM